MAMTPLRVLLFIFGGLIGAGAVAFYAGLFTPPSAQDDGLATMAESVLPEEEPEEKQEESAADSAKSTEASADVEKDSVGQEQVVVPAFDLLRAEPDGSLVVAGRAAPGSDVEVLSGSSILAMARSGPSGDFAAVLDEPLKPGEYNIVLRATSPDNNVAATSMETAIVSIPTPGSNQVVALVQQPGKPSRLISVPQPEQLANSDAEVPAEAEGNAPETEPAAELAENGGMAADGTSEPVETAGDRASAEEEAGETEEAATRDTDAARERREAALAPATPNDADAVAKVTGEQRSGTVRQEQVGESGEQEVAVAPAEPESGRAEENADVRKAPPQSSAREDDAPFIEAVEIDGRKIFVAGRAKPNSRLRIYANETLLGQTTTSPQGQFLLEAERDLPVGDYIIRADVLADDGSSVIARAAVPFDRRAGEQIAAVASETLTDTANEANMEGADAVRPAETLPDEDTDASGADASAASPLRESRKVFENSGSDEVSGEGGTGQNIAAAGKEPGRSQAPEGVQEVVAQALQPADGAVIIRRGDTLWQISRRIYGRGVRYTTIYLANQEQIRDPDLIWPGQIFKVPEETDAGEKANLEAVSEQAISPEAILADEEE
ncbi:LysM peptidoglycan-binding domain-containing protein [Chelativorans sp. Marseille-P2723]|uniref:LysM peptidoglycan-binding domain-containing protein n=1 Tax=Chelativorans sp. Marseille-P2723 TaxID=2709133 RepID=UPI001FEEB72A|nr:LysM peptidoglycan-binding domain-containing protein [Chelativorans sp. Marseille-P2723]